MPTRRPRRRTCSTAIAASPTAGTSCVPASTSCADNRSSQAGYLTGDSETLVAAELQNLVRTIVERNGGRLESTQILPPVNEAAFRRVTLRVRMSVGVEGLFRILYDLESMLPYLFVDGLDIVSRERRGGRQSATAGGRGDTERQLRRLRLHASRLRCRSGLATTTRWTWCGSGGLRRRGSLLAWQLTSSDATRRSRRLPPPPSNRRRPKLPLKPQAFELAAGRGLRRDRRAAAVQPIPPARRRRRRAIRRRRRRRRQAKRPRGTDLDQRHPADRQPHRVALLRFDNDPKVMHVAEGQEAGGWLIEIDPPRQGGGAARRAGSEVDPRLQAKPTRARGVPVATAKGGRGGRPAAPAPANSARRGVRRQPSQGDHVASA